MAHPTFEDLIREADERGWAVAERPTVGSAFGSLRFRFEHPPSNLGLSPVPVRRGDGTVSLLRPTTQEDAHPASISATVGLGEQPLHTDGAHRRRVPDYVVMWSSSISATPTRVWNPRGHISADDRAGVFMVSSSADDIWLTGATDHLGLRFDPGCMKPCDAFARALARKLTNPPPDEVHEVHWDVPDRVLLLHNRRVLHGRAAVADGDFDRALGRIAYYKEGHR